MISLFNSSFSFFLYLFLGIFLLLLIWELLTRKFVNKYILDVCYGPKGVGKSTLIVKYAFKYAKKGWKIACNLHDLDPALYAPDLKIYAFPAAEIDLFARAYEDLKVRSRLEKKYASLNLDHYFLEPDTLIFIDEINLLWDNRDFASFPPGVRDYFRLQRHYKHKIIAFSQTFDQDKKIRTLADLVTIIDRFARVLITGKTYRQKPRMIKNQPETGGGAKSKSNAQTVPCDDYIRIGILPYYIAWLPKWVKKHNSYSLSALKSNGSPAPSGDPPRVRNSGTVGKAAGGNP